MRVLIASLAILLGACGFQPMYAPVGGGPAIGPVQVGEIEGKAGQTYEKVLEDLMLTEADLKAQIAADLRWDKYASQQATDKALHDFFEANKEIFDGTMVRARHILLTPAGNDAQAADKAKADLLLMKQQIEQHHQQQTQAMEQRHTQQQQQQMQSRQPAPRSSPPPSNERR